MTLSSPMRSDIEHVFTMDHSFTCHLLVSNIAVGLFVLKRDVKL